MGNSHSNHHSSSHHSSSHHSPISPHGHGHARQKASHENPAALKSFGEIAEGRSVITESDFERVFGDKIGPLLWKNVFNDRSEVDQDSFSRHYYDLCDIRADQCTEMFTTTEEFLDACLSTAGKGLKSEKSEFVSALIHDAEKGGSAQFFNTHCPSLAQNTVIRHIKNVFCPSSEQIIFAVDSMILSPLQLLLIQGSLSEMVYFKHKQATQPCWSKIYESHSHGLSVNRFEANVFGYTSPTVSIFHLNDGHLYAIANNTEWRHTTKYLGSTLSKCVQIVPHFKFIDSRHEEPIQCNFKFRTAPFGLGFRDVFTIDGDFSNVDAIEVWGCGNDSSLHDQKSSKQRQRNQAERNQKVPLPGHWDENPDKAVLEMAGHTFSHERDRHKPEPPHEDDK